MAKMAFGGLRTLICITLLLSSCLANRDIPISELSHEGPEFSPDQLKMQLWATDAMLFTWATGIDKIQADTRPPHMYDPNEVCSTVELGASPSTLSTVIHGNNDGIHSKRISYTYPQSLSAGCFKNCTAGSVYRSPIIHHVIAPNLKPGKKYYYRVGCEQKGGFSSVQSFVMPANTYPFVISALGDVDQKTESRTTLEKALADKPGAVIIMGDVSYADYWFANNTRLARYNGRDTMPSKWDSWSRLFAPLLSTVPVAAVTIGNHDLEDIRINGDRNNVIMGKNFNARYPGPQNRQKINTDTIHKSSYWVQSNRFEPQEKTNGIFVNNAWYSVNAGPAHIINLCNYCPYAPGSEQYNFLKKDLQAVDREKTPWVLVTFHAPWYSSFDAHYRTNDEMRSMMEPLLLKYGVDAVLTGHVHSGELSYNGVYNFTKNDCGTMYYLLGNAGYTLSRSTIEERPPRFCEANYIRQPSIQPNYLGHAYVAPGVPRCWSTQPPYSKRRLIAYGHGKFTLLSKDEAKFEFISNNPADPPYSFVMDKSKKASCRIG